MRLGEPWFYATCTGFNDSVKGTFQVGGRMTWLEDSELVIGSSSVPAYHVFEERTIIDTNDTGTHGTLGVILLMAMTAFAIVVFFSRNPGLEKNALTTKVVPAVTGLVLLAVIVTIVRNFGDLAGASGALAIILPGLVLLAALLGLVLAMRLKGADPVSYARLGLGQAN